jgi:hypothetical protein
MPFPKQLSHFSASNFSQKLCAYGFQFETAPRFVKSLRGANDKSRVLLMSRLPMFRLPMLLSMEWFIGYLGLNKWSLGRKRSWPYYKFLVATARHF